ncbi:uncharacterized protein LOC131976446 [Centropristis striata]|uniref:uncharacterized protein LOC131976446 n=1 Tax=Centropristis striata TaxID=184440 RepID=UPI0027E00979|nr:uncharacterized protein LOC131976446 [Centropristis striata]XP_059195466.1 uncharacterized protein LOC131976446 [Centropristis striata]
MSVSMTRADGVTVMTVTSDSQNVCPPLCQIISRCCYSRACCSVSQHLRRIQGSSQSLLGALQIMVGLLTIGLGVLLCSSHSATWFFMERTLFPLWFGGVCMLFGSMCILSEKCPSRCLVIINVILNLSGVAVTIAAIVFYSVSLANTGLYMDCRNRYDYYGRGRHSPTDDPSPGDRIIMQKCEEGLELILLLVTGINSILIILSTLELCLLISSGILGIKALRYRVPGENQESVVPPLYDPQWKEVPSDPTA